jgi:hypothetical protein
MEDGTVMAVAGVGRRAGRVRPRLWACGDPAEPT